MLRNSKMGQTFFPTDGSKDVIFPNRGVISAGFRVKICLCALNYVLLLTFFEFIY